MYFELKQKEVKNTYGNCIYALRYGSAQRLLHIGNREHLLGYTVGYYGWNCDVYNFNSFAITVGYRSFGVGVAQDIADRYEARIEKRLAKGFSDYRAREKYEKRVFREFASKLEQLTEKRRREGGEY